MARTPRWSALAVRLAARAAAGWLLALLIGGATLAHAQTSLVSAPDAALAPLFKQIDPAFIAWYKKTTGRDARIEQKVGLPSVPAKANSKPDATAADVIALGDPGKANALVQAGLIAADWRQQFPSDAAPWSTTVVFVVREGNPKRIKTFGDLAKPGVRVVLPDPASTVTGRHGWLGAWGVVKKSGGSDGQAVRQAVKLLANGWPPAANEALAIEQFIRQGEGDALVALERDVPKILQSAQEQGRGKLAVVVPPASVIVPQPVAIVLPPTRKKGTSELARAYLNFLYSDAAQQMAAMHSLRPVSKEIAKQQAARFKPVKLFSVADVFSSDAKADQSQFGAGGWFEKLRAAQAAKPSPPHATDQRR